MSDVEASYVSADELDGGAIAAEPADEFRLPLGRLLAIRPFGVKTISEGVPKPFPARECYVIAVDEDGYYEDLGMRDCAWQAVMRELDKATDEAPWVVGTVAKGSRAYFLQPPNADEMKLALSAISALIEDRRQEEATAREVEESFSGEEPF